MNQYFKCGVKMLFTYKQMQFEDQFNSSYDVKAWSKRNAVNESVLVLFCLRNFMVDISNSRVFHFKWHLSDC